MRMALRGIWAGVVDPLVQPNERTESLQYLLYLLFIPPNDPALYALAHVLKGIGDERVPRTRIVDECGVGVERLSLGVDV